MSADPRNTAQVALELAQGALDECRRLRERLTLQDRLIDDLRTDVAKLQRTVLELEAVVSPSWPDEVADVD